MYNGMPGWNGPFVVPTWNMYIIISQAFMANRDGDPPAWACAYPPCVFASVVVVIALRFMFVAQGRRTSTSTTFVCFSRSEALTLQLYTAHMYLQQAPRERQCTEPDRPTALIGGGDHIVWHKRNWLLLRCWCAARRGRHVTAATAH